MVGTSRAAQSAVNSALRALVFAWSRKCACPSATPATPQSAVAEDGSVAESTSSSSTVVLSSPGLSSGVSGDPPRQASLDASAEPSASLATTTTAPSATSLVDVPVGNAASDSMVSGGAVSREFLEQIIMEASAKSSERVTVVLGPRLDLIGRLNVTLHQGPNIRGDRHVGSRLAATHSLHDVVAVAQPNMGVHDDINLDLAMMRGQFHSAEAARAAVETSMMRESFKHKNTMVFLKQESAELEHSKKEIKRLRLAWRTA
ncbi:uncharacterized protein IUM83_03715 [Phytophthora cinnamomi]|uniref:uncharacterized protein n=1 Tax=Phytophthora cinnamomi TaxID=4785 RepID=UPI00355A2C68|nr:hypothetical protein IUM83_03715 [Phytophthora cinnamomi]